MTYVRLGSPVVVATPDTTGHNANNWTCVFDKRALGISQPHFEMYHMYVQAPTLTGAFTTIKVMLNSNMWDATLVGQLNSWDPSQPMLMEPGDILYVLFNVPTTTTPAPEVTAWFRYNHA